MGQWKEFWCEHIYKTEESILLGETRLSDGVSMLTWSNYKIYGDIKICLKCNKKDIKERKVMIV